jgi:TolB-like protein
VPEPAQTKQAPPPAAIVAPPPAVVTAPPVTAANSPEIVAVPETSIFHSNAVAPVNAAQTVTVDVETVDTIVIKSPSTRVQNIAVVKTEIDAQSGASAELTSADARLVTAELRREAVKNLPRGKYNVMTSETVYAQGSAVLEACADENSVIVLGSAIGADYIVRGTISKVQTRFTLTVEIYETEDGNLVASSAPIRSESLENLLEKAAPICADMYKTFVNAQIALLRPASGSVAQEPGAASQRSHKTGISVGVGAVYAGSFDGGIVWSNAQVTMP